MADKNEENVSHKTLMFDNLVNFPGLVNENNIERSNYFEIDKASKLSQKKSFNTIHINIQSLPSKFEKVKEMIVDFKNNGVTIDCLMLCETFLKNSFTGLFNIPEYNLTFINREQKPRGGVAMYIHEKHDFIVRKDLSTFIEGQFEYIFVEI